MNMQFTRYVLLAILVFSGTARAGVIELDYVADSTLRSVGFDGTQFTGGFTNLESLVPDWSAMSYDVANNLMYYVADSTLRSVGFDGSQFTGGFTNLESLIPDWNAMSYDVDNNLMYYVADSTLRSVGFDGTQFTGGFTNLESLVPNWNAMSHINDSASTVPVPSTLLLIGLALTCMGFQRYQGRNTGPLAHS
jgi:hypothetical protein